MANDKGKATEEFLIGIPLPNHASTYTVISHGEIIQKIENELNINGLIIENRDYSYSYDGEIALGKLSIIDSTDPDLQIVFTWINSYNKLVKFGCGIGGLIVENKSVMLSSEGTSWLRKHTGSANEEAYDIIEQLVQSISELFGKLIAEKELMKTKPVDTERFGQIMGSLFFENSLLTPTQANAVKKEWEKSEFKYTDKNTLWGLYKMIMYGIEIGDIKNWHNTQQKLHNMIMVEYAIAEQKVVSLGLDTSNIDTSVEQEERPAHHEPLIPTQEELDAEHVGPTEMYLGDVEVIRPKTDIQSRIEAINAAEEVEEDIEVVVEVEEEDLDENEDLVSITNVAVQLGYKAVDVKVFFKAKFDETIGLSANLKAFRMWADTGKKPFAETIKEAPIVLPVVPQEVEVEDTFELMLENHEVENEIQLKVVTEPVETEEGFEYEVEEVETIEEVPVVEVVKEKLPDSPLSKLDLFIERCSEKGYSSELLDFYTKEHFDSTDSLEDNIEAFVKWAPVPAVVKEAKAKTVIKETPVETVVEKVEADSIEKVIQKKTTEQENMVQVAKSLFDAPTVAPGTITKEDIVAAAVYIREQEQLEEVVEEKTMTDVLDMSPLPVEIIEPTRPTEDEAIENLLSMEEESEEEEDIFDISGGLEASEELLAEAKLIEERMILLYGSVRNYHTEEVEGYINVIIDDSLERFAVKQ